MADTGCYIVTTVPQCDCEITQVPEDNLIALKHCPLHAAAPQMLEALEAVELVEIPRQTSSHHRECPWCRWMEFDGHAPDCKREAAIAAARGEA